MLSSKIDMKNKFINQDPHCRLCNTADESLTHIVNCGEENSISEENLSKLFSEDINIKEATKVAKRIERFMKKISEEN